MPPKPTNDQHDNSDDDESQDASGFVRALHDHAARVEQLVAQDRELATQQFRTLIQEDQRISAESQTALADALATAVGKAIAQNFQGVPTSQPGPSGQPPPVAAFGGLRLHAAVDNQPAYPATTSGAWQLGSSQEYQPNPATHAAAAAAPTIGEPRVFAPFPAALDTGRFPYGQFNPQVAGRQRVFTINDPPTKRDIAEAFVHIQQVARNSPHIGRREIAELQLLECYVQLWDCRCIGLPARDKLRIFDRLPLRATRTPPPLSSLGPSPSQTPSGHPSRLSRPWSQSAPDQPPQHPLGEASQVPQEAKKVSTDLTLTTATGPSPVPRRPPLQTHVPQSPPAFPASTTDCSDLLASLDAPLGVPRALDIVLGPARPCAALVDGVPTLALLQDVLLPEDLLAQAIREAGLPTLSSPFLPVSGRSPAAGSSGGSSVSSRASASAESDEFSPGDSLAGPSPGSDTEGDPEGGEDSLADAALRILRWLAVHQPFPLPGDPEDDDDDTAFPSGPPHFPVRPSEPPPNVNWALVQSVFGYAPPFDPAALNFFSKACSLEVLRAAVTSMLDAGIIEPTVRGPVLSPIQVVPKTSTSSRFVLDCSHLTPHLPSPPFVLPKALQICPLPRTPFFTKINLRDAFYHFRLSPQTRALTRFRLDGCYYQYTVLPFGIPATGQPVDPQWVDLFSFLLLHLPASVPFKTVPVTSSVYADASGTGLGICLPDGNVAVVTSTPHGIYRRELWAVLLAILLSPPRTLVLSDNQAVVAALTHGHGRTFNICEALAATILLCNKESWVAWLPTDSNLADAPSRLNRTLFRGHERGCR
ncbi:hypothetical protein HPB47_007381 [Ixodes persulcatus]|uniref:Uncharacterized protein n=1 Tax=Ixodes persulcatus TaxID=34615 RepID=A0AC60P7R1_IXOPE|nr:hypothetical protein HPB47_007381 [Ixodes persulcatus]